VLGRVAFAFGHPPSLLGCTKKSGSPSCPHRRQLCIQEHARRRCGCRQASSAVIELKVLVDRTAEKVRAAERRAKGTAIGQRESDDALRMFRVAAEDLQSADFEAALFHARARTQAAIASLSIGHGRQT
jgi:hypothetical protein